MADEDAKKAEKAAKQAAKEAKFAAKQAKQAEQAKGAAAKPAAKKDEKKGGGGEKEVDPSVAARAYVNPCVPPSRTAGKNRRAAHSTPRPAHPLPPAISVRAQGMWP